MSDISDLWGREVGDDTKANIFSPRMNVPLNRSNEYQDAGRGKKNILSRIPSWMSFALGVLLGTVIAGFAVYSVIEKANKKTLQQSNKALVLFQHEVKACAEDKTQAQRELAVCAVDVDEMSNKLTSLATPMSATPDSRRLKNAVNQKAALEKEIDELEVRIFDSLQRMRRPQDITKVFWRELRRNIKLHKRLSVRQRQAAAAYEIALTAAATRPSAESIRPDAELLERNHQRVEYLKKAQNESSPLGPSTPVD